MKILVRVEILDDENRLMSGGSRVIPLPFELTRADLSEAMGPLMLAEKERVADSVRSRAIELHQGKP